MANTPVRSPINQSEYGVRPSGLGAAIQRAAYALHFGRLTILPYPLGEDPEKLHEGSSISGDFGTFVPWMYVPTPLYLERGYWGEAYLSMQPFYHVPHPTGLPDDFPAGIGGPNPFGERG